MREARDELKPLMNLKTQELQERLSKIRKTGGVTSTVDDGTEDGEANEFDEEVLDEEFDPEKHDEQVKHSP